MFINNEIEKHFTHLLVKILNVMFDFPQLKKIQHQLYRAIIWTTGNRIPFPYDVDLLAILFFHHLSYFDSGKSSSNVLLRFPLFQRRFFEHWFHTTGLLRVEFNILWAFRWPRRIELGCILINQMSVFCPSGSTKVLDLHNFGQNGFIEMIF